MDWVKLGSSYFLDVAIACLDDAGEVMFLRGLAVCGASESGGFIPAALLPTLGRRNQAKTAATIVAAGKWEAVDGGYRVVQWEKWQAELEALLGRRRKDAARKRRARSGGQSALFDPDASADTGADNGGTESRGEENTPPDGGAGGDVEPAGPSINQRAQALARTYVELVPLSRFPAILIIAKKAIDAGYADDAIDAALCRLAAEGRPVTVDVLRVELEGMPASRLHPSGVRVEVLAGAMERARAAEAAHA